MTKRLFVLLVVALLAPLLAEGQASRVLYDSGSVAAGAQIQTPVLDLSTARVGEIQIIIDNTAGTALRDLTLTSYLEDGVTTIDSVVLRKVAFGAAPTGSAYAQGQVRGYVGPNPPAGASGTHVLYEATSADNGTLATGNLCVDGQESVMVAAGRDGGAAAGGAVAVRFIEDDGTDIGFGAIAITQNINTAQEWTGYAIGPGSSGYSSILLGYATTLPRRIAASTTAPGAGNFVRLRVLSRGPVPGSFSVQQVLPMKGRLTLAAAGSGAARLTVLGR